MRLSFVLSRSSLVLLAASVSLSACDGAKDDAPTTAVEPSEETAKEDPAAESEPSDQPAAMPKACERKGAPDASGLGLEEAAFIECLGILLEKMPLPEDLDTKIVKEGPAYTVPGLMMIQIQSTEGAVNSMDIFFLNELRDKHGMEPELLAQFATLAIVFPSAKVEPTAGEAIFKEVDAIGRKTNNPIIDYAKDGIALNASFLPVSVRYRFTARP